jgi:HlyD family secretion protein
MSLTKIVLVGSGLSLLLASALHRGHLGRLASLPLASLASPGAAAAPSPGTAGDLPRRVVAEGRVVAYPGAEVLVGAELAGKLVRIDVAEKSAVRQGDLIAELRSDELKASLQEAEAHIAEIGADVVFFERQLRRSSALLGRGVGTQADQDSHQQKFNGARARLSAAKATRDRLAAMLDKTRITSPIDGVVVARLVQPGETVEALKDVVKVVDLSRLRIEAEVDEFDTGRVDLGDEVVVEAEGFPGACWTGRVEEIPDAVIARRINPEDPGRPTDTRVLPVKIALVEPTPLKLGQRVEVTIRPAGRRADSVGGSTALSTSRR